MALWIAETGLSIGRYMFMLALLGQLSDPNYPTHNNYVYSSDFMWNSKTTFVNGVEKTIPSACAGGPKGQLPKFDYIVVGSGPGGSVVAHKLAVKFPTKTVLIVEAGPQAPVNTVSPAMFAFGLKVEGTVAYHSNPSPNFGNGLMYGANCYASRTLGGTSNINVMAMICGADRDYNYWANITQDESWNYDNMRPHVKNIMNMHNPLLTQDPECSKTYGTSGPLNVGPYGGDEVFLTTLLRDASVEKGYRILKDINCGKWTGFTKFSGAIYGGERQSAAIGFLAPLKDHKNLIILNNAIVDKVLVDESSKGNKARVKGVSVVTKNEECLSFELRAKEEIIISAGAFSTPLILQRSGIGRAADLKPYNIRQKLNLNVGHNYRDHLLTYHVVTIPTPAPDNSQVMNEINRYFTERKGMFSNIGAGEHMIFLNLDDPSSNIPDNQWLFIIFPRQLGELEQVLKYHMEFNNHFANQMLDLNQENLVILFLNSIVQPKSSGYVGVRSTSAFDEPKILGNYFSNDDDIVKAIQGIREFQTFLSTSVMRNANASMPQLKIDECDKITYNTDAYWRCYIKYLSNGSWHGAGTARMGQKGDKDAVVDNRLRVIGVEGKPGLRVSDASAMPQITSGNPMCSIYSLGDRAAEMIIEDSN